ncbi:L-rhamnose mutarotase [Ruania suaedae]|uniref:L-rhamnose mutarotase n=1 Tax=Ruania suaedae TaxID=2897774 RepID=UPI001E28ED86|nr:L-rhamnose mutarotase [Ruania suaedae]UFU03270.1 L-rhamnose mutarotase [Ruania suaedae]
MQIALHSRIKPGHEEAYERDHQAIPEGMVEEFARLGVHDWKIWRSGRDLFHLVECDDFEAAMRELEHSEPNARWQEFINTHLDGFASFGEGPTATSVPLVWTLQDQRRS